MIKGELPKPGLTGLTLSGLFWHLVLLAYATTLARRSCWDLFFFKGPFLNLRKGNEILRKFIVKGHSAT